MRSHPDSTSVREAREQFFGELAYADGGGYEAKVFRIKLGPVSLPLPNLPSRVEAVRFHDLHHLGTGYRTDWIGEAEVGAWELATGCRYFWAAWLLNFAAFTVGLVLAPRRVFRAFVRGRHSRNLYGETFDDRLLDQSLGDLRRTLDLDRTPTPGSFGDVGVFSLWVLAALVVAVVPIAALAALFWLAAS